MKWIALVFFAWTTYASAGTHIANVKCEHQTLSQVPIDWKITDQDRIDNANSIDTPKFRLNFLNGMLAKKLRDHFFGNNPEVEPADLLDLPQFVYEKRVLESIRRMKFIEQELEQIGKTLNSRPYVGAFLTSHRWNELLLNQDLFFTSELIDQSINHLAHIETLYFTWNGSERFLGESSPPININTEPHARALVEAWQRLKEFHNIASFLPYLRRFRETSEALYSHRCAEIIKYRTQLVLALNKLD